MGESEKNNISVVVTVSDQLTFIKDAEEDDDDRSLAQIICNINAKLLVEKHYQGGRNQ